MMEVSVVIPTYKRKDILARCLEAFSKQDFDPKKFEVLVVEDGESGDSQKMVEELGETSTFKIRYFSQAHQGQGVARNLGVKESHGNIVVFVGDDIFPSPNFLNEHFHAHQKYTGPADAILGLTLWHPDIQVTPLMDFMTRGGALFGKYGGHQFAYDLLEGKEEADYRFFYTSNISLKRRLIYCFPFDGRFAGYGWEDIELGYRLAKTANLRLFYNPKAIGYHYHPMKDFDFERRMHNIGKSLRLFHEKYHDLNLVPSGKKKLLFSILASSPIMKLLKRGEKSKSETFRNLYYYALSKKYFLEGFHTPFGAIDEPSEKGQL